MTPHRITVPLSLLGIAAIADDRSDMSKSPSLGWKTPILIGITILGTVGLLYASAAIVVLNSFSRLEKQTMEQNIQRVTDAIWNESKGLEATAKDYATWDDAYQFSQDQNEDFVTQNLHASTYESLDLDVMAVVNADDQIVYGKTYEADTDQLTALPDDLSSYLESGSALLHHRNTDESHAGIITLAQGPLIIASLPIITSNGDGPIQGSMLMGRFLDSAELNKLSELTHVNLSIYPMDAASLPDDVKRAYALLQDQTTLIQPINRNTIAGYVLLNDMAGKPAALLRVETPRDIYHQGLLSLKSLAISLLAAGLLTGIVIWLLLNKLLAHATERDRMQQALMQETTLRRSETRYREKAIELEKTLYELRRTQAQLIHSEKMSSLGQLVAGLAHEINNPVGFIKGNVPYIREYWQELLEIVARYQAQCPGSPTSSQDGQELTELAFLSEDFDKILGSIQNGSERIQQIVLSLRNFARLDEAEMKRVDIHEGIDSALVVLQHKLKEQSHRPAIAVIKNYGNLPLVECYPGQLNQVFMNLLANAIDALGNNVGKAFQAQSTTGKPVAPTIWIKTTMQGTQHIAIHIKDNGCGISESARQKLFDPFYTTKPVGQGIGLGLSISHQIVVEEHRGQLRCFSALDRGAEFIVHIPIYQSENAPPGRSRAH